jgi:predicted nucleotide-binding protein (sugar kinase/HSP70/actin superfamily)
VAHFRRPVERPFTRSEREHVTLLFGGLTMRHDLLLLAGLEGLGYRVAHIPVPRKADFQAGKEYGNNGQCNPTYFTVGALVNYLRDLRDVRGLSTEDILRDYVFVTAGACGPCRFGMYEAEYRLALRNSGFEGFRVLLFQQAGGLSQSEVEAGLEMNLGFFTVLLNAVFMGDLLNEVAYQIRPYEVVPGRTDAVLARCLERCQARLRASRSRGGRLAGLLSRATPLKDGHELRGLIDQLWGEHHVGLFRECARLIQDEIEVDYTRCRPIVKITGEFWAQTTEGDGNFNMFSFLEREGAEVLVEPVSTWISYLIHGAMLAARDRRGLAAGAVPGRAGLRARWRAGVAHGRKMLALNLADRLVTREYERLRRALGGTTHPLASQPEMQRVAHPYYNTRSGGGEGHLEVAKNIYYCSRGLCHMVLSLKPFGCMPSTQSDGAQAAVVAHYPDIIFLPIETSGEGDINAHSRVQMVLGEAKARSKEEFRRVLAETGRSLEEIRAFVGRPENRDLRRPLLHLPEYGGVVGRGARFVRHAAERMKG